METKNKKTRGTTNISATISTSLNERVDAYLNENVDRHVNRSMLIEMALENYLNMIYCPQCHRQTASARFCSYCGNQLDISDTDKKVAEFLYYEQHPEHAPDKDSKEIITVSLTDSQIRRLLNGDMVEQADVNIVTRKQYTKNVHDYIANRRKNTKISK